MNLAKTFKIFLVCLIIFLINCTFNIINTKITPSSACNTNQSTKLNILWNTTFVLPYQDEPSSIIKCPSEGYAIAGWTNSSGKGDYDILFMRISSNGLYLWNRTFGGVEEDKGYQVINCNLGGFIIVSTFTNTTAMYTNTDLLITKIANNGFVLWNKSYSGPDQDDITYWVGDLGRSIVECSNGDIVIAGATIPKNGDCDIWLQRLSPLGTKIWARTFNHWETDRCFTPHSLVQCADSGFAIVGYTYNSTTSNDVWLIRTNQNGFELWNQTFGDATGYQRPEGLVECADGGFAIIANTQSFCAGSSDAWIIRTDNLGNQLWNKTYGGLDADGADFITATSDGGFTFCGSTQSYDIGQGDAWLVRTDENGTITWNHTIGDSYGNTAQAIVNEGNETYTVVGKTLRQGEPFEDIWIFKVQILIITTTATPTEPNSYPTIIFTIGILLLIFFIRLLFKNKKLRI